ncbi:MAG: RelA/SpoT family protein [Deltaproteobacteria bacterium]|jgi:GTP pyrophosphokinase|nr:RelA/SpoT family protein [Deltaproteobacteria bacterium]
MNRDDNPRDDPDSAAAGLILKPDDPGGRATAPKKSETHDSAPGRGPSAGDGSARNRDSVPDPAGAAGNRALRPGKSNGGNGGGRGPASDAAQDQPQTPASALDYQNWDVPLTEPTPAPDEYQVQETEDEPAPRPAPVLIPEPRRSPLDYRQPEDVSFYSNRPVRIEEIIDSMLRENPLADEDLIRRAYVRASIAHKGAMRLSKEPYLNHPLAVAAILCEMKLDTASVAAGLLHDTVEDTPLTVEDIRGEFNDDVANIVDGVTKIAKFNFSSETERRATNMRKMFLSMLADLRVIFVKLADRLNNMRTLGYMTSQKQIDISRETLDFFAPLASRLGIHKIQAELEDLALFYLDPSEFETIRKSLSLFRENSTAYVEQVRQFLIDKMTEFNVHCEVEGRPKHIYSIYRKMKRQNLPLDQIYDLIAFRIIVPDVQTCYTTLGIVHTIFKVIPGRFKDYINIPKLNGYQSIHTAIIGPDNYRMEIQIRTRDMHTYAEEGVAAHWRYKEGGKAAVEENDLIATLRSLISWQETEDPSGFLRNLKESLVFDQVTYVFTPAGRPIELPAGATVLDFAYAVHTEVGHHCKSAMVNNVMTSIRHPLETGDVVKINTSSKPNVSEDWTRHAVSPKARYKIRQFLKEKDKKEKTALGENLIRSTMTRLKLSKSRLDAKVLEGLGYKKLDDLNYAVGDGRVRINAVIEAIKPGLEIPKPPEKPAHVPQAAPQDKKAPRILVDGLENVSVHFPKCCQPMPGEPIVGFLTHTKGVSIHAASCPSVENLDRERMVQADWAEAQPDAGTVDVHIKINMADQKYLPGVINVLVAHNARITEFQQCPDFPNQVWFRIPVRDYGQCQEIIGAIAAMDHEITQVERFQPPFAPFPE